MRQVRVSGLVLALAASLAATQGARGQRLDPEKAALLVLNSARRAYNEKKYAFAAQRFDEFLKRYGGHREASAAWYGLALSLLEAPEKNFPRAAEALRRVTADKTFPDRPLALYYLGMAQRGMGNRATAKVADNRAKAATYHATARALLAQALAKEKQAGRLRASAARNQARGAAKTKEAQGLRNRSGQMVAKATALRKQAEQVDKAATVKSAKAAAMRKEADQLAKASPDNAAKAKKMRDDAGRLAREATAAGARAAGMRKEAGGLRKTASAQLVKIPAAEKEADNLRKAAKAVTVQAVAVAKQGREFRAKAQQAKAKGDAKLRETPQLPAEAQRRFAEAAGSFAAATAAFSALPKKTPEDLQWIARTSSDTCEMLLRTGKFKEAGERAAAMLGDTTVAKGSYRGLGLYYFGYARLATKDYLDAGRALSKLAPFRQEFGLHARFLLARVHHLSDERPEAAAQYKSVLADFASRKKSPAEPAPDYVLRAEFYIALMACEDGRYGNAADGFSALLKKHLDSSLVSEAQLRVGFCQMRMGEFSEAIRTLQPLVGHRRLGDRATWWLGLAQIGAADAKKGAARAAGLRVAIDTLRRASDLAGQLARSDPAAKIRRGDILLELGDAQQLAGRYREAAGTYQRALAEKNNPQRDQEAMQRQAAALHLAGDYANSDVVCGKFEQAYPKSVLLPEVLFCGAENAYLTAVKVARNVNLPNRARELAKRFAPAIARYRRVIERHPGFARVNHARQGMGMSYYRLGRYAKAIAPFEAIRADERDGELAATGYLLADCLIRTLPTDAGDALRAARLVRQAGRAAKLLEVFLGAHPKRPEAPDAMLKLGHCRQRIGEVLAPGPGRVAAFKLAREVYDRFVREFAKHPSRPTALFERAKCLVEMGNRGGAISELNAFRTDPLRRSWIAPLAVIRLSALLRMQRAPAEAVKVITPERAYHEGALLRDPTRKGWAPALQYEHALAVKEAGKPADAAKMFDALVRRFPGRPEAVNAVWRAAQCRREQSSARLAEARRTLAKPGAKPQEIQAADKLMTESLNGLRKTVEDLLVQAEMLDRRAPDSTAHLRMRYEAAWCYRVLAAAEIQAARRKLARDQQQRRPVPIRAVSVRATEQAARDQYERLIAAAPRAALANQARFELAEMLAERGDQDAALALLAAGLAKSPPPALAEQMRLRSAACLLAKGDPKAAQAHVRAVMDNPKSAFAAQARYLAGEVALQQRDWAGAVRQLLVFRDDKRFQQVAGIADRALLRLGHAYARARQWPQSRQALEVLVQRFRGRSPWIADGFYGIGRAWRQAKRYDNAVRAYQEVTRRTSAEVAAKAQVGIGACRLEQKRYDEATRALLVVPLTYGYAELSAKALCEAGRANVAAKRPVEAAKLFRQVIENHPKSRWAETARKRLNEIE